MAKVAVVPSMYNKELAKAIIDWGYCSGFSIDVTMHPPESMVKIPWATVRMEVHMSDADLRRLIDENTLDKLTNW